jgi:uncharacterized protein GlcG (DUF336 family)
VALLVALCLCGCESSQEKSARLKRQAHRAVAAQQGLVVRKSDPNVKVLSALAVHSANGTAAVVTLRNESARTLRDVPVALTVFDAHGAVLFQNNAPGLAPSLTSIALLKAHGEATWIDDQIQASGTPARVSVRVGVGEAQSAAGALPSLSIAGMHTFEDPASGLGVEGSLVNRSTLTQQDLVVFVVARRGGRIVAVGRAVLPEAAAGQSTSFQVFLIGSPKGAKLEASAPATTLG